MTTDQAAGLRPVRSRTALKPPKPRPEPVPVEQIGRMDPATLRVWAAAVQAAANWRTITLAELARTPGPLGAPIGVKAVARILGDLVDDQLLTLNPPLNTFGLDLERKVFACGWKGRPPQPQELCGLPKPPGITPTKWRHVRDEANRAGRAAAREVIRQATAGKGAA